jgi:hypothetical protein
MWPPAVAAALEPRPLALLLPPNLSALDYVMGVNIRRRHMSFSQPAVAGARIHLARPARR